MSAQHSPTPWYVEDADSFLNANVWSAGGGVVADCVAIAPQPRHDALRIVECVNACEELPDPARLPSAIASLRKLADTSRGETTTAVVARQVLDDLGVSL